jgi:Tol biopolymer transport system component
LESEDILNFQCSRIPANVCVVDRSEPKSFVFSTFDPVKGTQCEVARLEQKAESWNWGLSPDGTTIAAVVSGGTDSQIHLLSLTGKAPRTINLKDWDNLLSLDCAADSKGLFIPSNRSGHLSTLLYVDLAGNAHSLWQVKTYQSTWAIPSHDGKYVAISAPTTECNVWMLENF